MASSGLAVHIFGHREMMGLGAAEGDRVHGQSLADLLASAEAKDLLARTEPVDLLGELMFNRSVVEGVMTNLGSIRE